MRIMLLTILICLLAPSAVFAQAPGDWVLGRWQGGPYWFPGVVESRSAKKVTIAYDDGTRETLPIKLVRPYDWRVGSRVECQWAGGDIWYAGRIEKMGKDGSKINILYDDGGRERTRTGACRSR